MKTGDVLVTDYVSVSPYDAVSTIEDVLTKERFCVVKDTTGRYVGVLIPDDIARKPHRLVADCITDKPVLSCDDDIGTALVEIVRSSAGVLPVFRNDDFCGVVRQAELFEYYRKRYSNIHYCYKEVFNEAIHGIFIFDPARNSIIDANKMACLLTGLTALEVRGRILQDVFNTEEDFSVSDEGFDPEFSAYQGMELEVKPLGNATGRTVAIQSIQVIDNNLGIMVFGEKTTLREDSAFESVAKDMHARSDVHKAFFLERVSHELRTPINGILGMAKLLREEPLREQSKHYLELLINSVNNLHELVNDLIDIEQLETGILKLRDAEFDIHEFVKKNLEVFTYLARQKKLSFTLSVDPKIVYRLIGDHVRLRQVLINFLTNALKFTEKGFISITIEEKSLLNDTAVLRFIVSDSGIGIPENKQEKIFENFYQVNTAYSERPDGLGLGLAIAKQLTSFMGGSISVASVPGEGSTFDITIPFRFTRENKEQNFIEHEKIEIQKQDFRILVAEDEMVNNLYLCTLLRNRGFAVHSVNNGKEVLNAFDRERFDIILMDISMPEMDGFQATQFLRKEKKSRIPIIALTAHAYQSDRDKCIEIGMDDYVSKPINEHQLFQILEKFLNRETSEPLH